MLSVSAVSLGFLFDPNDSGKGPQECVEAPATVSTRSAAPSNGRARNSVLSEAKYNSRTTRSGLTKGHKMGLVALSYLEAANLFVK